MKYMGNDKPICPESIEKDLGFCFDLSGVPECPKPLEAWHPGLFIRSEKKIDGTHNHYFG